MPLGNNIDFTMTNLDEIVLGNIKKGQLISSIRLENDGELIHYDIKFLRELMGEVYKLYSSGEPDKKKFVELFEKHQKKFDTFKGDVMDRLADEKDDLFFVEERAVDKDGNITIRLKKLDSGERLKLLHSVSKKLMSKLTKKQLAEMLEEGIRKNNTIEDIKKMGEKLKKSKEPKVEGYKGCYKLLVDDAELIVSM